MSMFGVSEDKKAHTDAYRTLMNMDAWKDFEQFANAEVDASRKREDSKHASDLTIGYVCEERGIRKGILKLIQHAEQKREGV